MITKRAFLVGCPRSGTTLLQSMIASHSQVVSFPETHFFSKTLPINPMLRRLKLYGPKSRAIVEQFLDRNDYETLNPFEGIPPYKFFTRQHWCEKLLEILDLMTAYEAPKNSTDTPVWGLEKTPRHLHYISSIEQSQSPNKFLHILRKGEDVVASLHLATKRYPEQWHGERSIKKCIDWWNKSIRASLKYRERPNHFFVVYEQLIEDPETVLRTICAFLELDYEQKVLTNFHRTAESLKQEEEKWKNQNTSESLRKSNKLKQHFDPSTIEYITAKTLNIDFQPFYH